MHLLYYAFALITFSMFFQQNIRPPLTVTPLSFYFKSNHFACSTASIIVCAI